MQRLITFFLLIFIFHMAKGQDKLITVSGQALSLSDSSVAAHVHVMNKNNRRVVVADDMGRFYMKVMKNDTLLITSIGYYPRLIAAKDLTADGPAKPVYLEKKVYELEAVDIFPYGTYQEFKQAFLDMKVKEPVEPEVNLPEISKAEVPRGDNEGGITLLSFSPITALYNKFSKKGKELKKYKALIEEEKYQQLLDVKYNKKIVMQATGIKEDKEAEKFMKYCRIPDEIILGATQYELFKVIASCYNEYLKKM